MIPDHYIVQNIYKHARMKWLKALKLLGQLFDIETEEEGDAASAVKASCMVNLALLSQREGNLSEALSWCSKACKCVSGCDLVPFLIKFCK